MQRVAQQFTTLQVFWGQELVEACARPNNFAGLSVEYAQALKMVFLWEKTVAVCRSRIVYRRRSFPPQKLDARHIRLRLFVVVWGLRLLYECVVFRVCWMSVLLGWNECACYVAIEQIFTWPKYEQNVWFLRRLFAWRSCTYWFVLATQLRFFFYRDFWARSYRFGFSSSILFT